MNASRLSGAGLAAAAVAIIFLGSAPANAACFESGVDKAVLSNEGCVDTTMVAMPLNLYEIANIATIRKVEQQKACF